MTFRLAEAVDLSSLDEVFTKAVRPVLVVDPAVASHPALATIDWPTVPVASGEPTVESVSAAISAIELVDAATIVAIGGGSTLDTAKLASCLSVGQLRGLLGSTATAKRQTTLVAAPTTAGSGAEVTRTCVLSDRGRKTWIWGDSLRADHVVLAPELTAGAPEGVTVAAAFDALVHAVEAHTSVRFDRVATEAATHTVAILPSAFERAVADPGDLDARRALLEAACCAGVAIDRCGTGLAHAIGHAVASLVSIPHGLAVALGLRVALPHNLGADADIHSALTDRTDVLFDAVLETGRFADHLTRYNDQPLDPDALFRAVTAVENRPMLENNVWRPTIRELHRFVDEIVETWESP